MSKPITIRDIQVITTQPYSYARHVVVKVLTSEPGLYGVGCASFTTKFHSVVTALENISSPICSATMSRALKRSGRWQCCMAIGATARS